MSNVLDTPEKAFVLDFVERNRGALNLLGYSIFYFAELGMHEHRSAALMTGPAGGARLCGGTRHFRFSGRFPRHLGQRRAGDCDAYGIRCQLLEFAEIRIDRTR